MFAIPSDNRYRGLTALTSRTLKAAQVIQTRFYSHFFLRRVDANTYTPALHLAVANNNLSLVDILVLIFPFSTRVFTTPFRKNCLFTARPARTTAMSLLQTTCADLRCTGQRCSVCFRVVMKSLHAVLCLPLYPSLPYRNFE